MAMRAARLATALLAVFALGSCQALEFIFGSVFPSSATLMKAQADLSGQIPANSGGNSPVRVRVVESGAQHGYVVVTANLASTGNTAFLYDLDLNPVKTMTGPLTALGVMADLNGNIVVGNIALNPADLSLAPVAQQPSTAGVSVSVEGVAGVDGFLGTGANIANFSLIASSSILNSAYYSTSWAAGVNAGGYPAISATQFNLFLQAIFEDGAGNAYFVISPNSNPSSATCSFVTIPKSGIATANPTGASSFDTAPHRDNLATETLGFSQGTVFVYDKGSSSILRIDPITGNTLSSYTISTDWSSMRFAYRVSGGYFYTFDTKTRLLTKYSAWW